MAQTPCPLWAASLTGKELMETPVSCGSLLPSGWLCCLPLPQRGLMGHLSRVQGNSEMLGAGRARGDHLGKLNCAGVAAKLGAWVSLAFSQMRLS